MLFRATVKWPGHNGELYLEAKDGLDLANQLRRLNKEFGPGSDINLSSQNEDLVYKYHNAKTSDYREREVNKRTELSQPVTRDFLTDTQGKWYIPKHIQLLKKMLVDDITLSLSDKLFLDFYNAKLAHHEAGKKIIPTAELTSAVIAATHPAPTQEENDKYEGLSDATHEAYALKQWRDKEGDTIPVTDIIDLPEDQKDLEEIKKEDILKSGPAGYQTLLQAYRDYRDNATAHEELCPGDLNKAGGDAWVLKHKGQPVIQIYGPMSEKEFNKHFQPYAKARQSSVTRAVRSVADSFFTLKNLLNPFFGITLGVSALGIQTLLAVFSPTALAAAAPVLINLSLIGGVLGALALVPYAIWAVATDVASKTDSIHRRMGFDLTDKGIDVEITAARGKYPYYRDFARYYAEGLLNRFNAWKENHKYQFVGVGAGVVAFVLLTLFTSLCLGQVAGFEFMQPVLDFLTSMITSSLAGITSVGSAAAPMALFITTAFLTVGPLAFAHFARTFGQTVHEAQYAAHRLDHDSEHKQDQKRALSVTHKAFNELSQEVIDQEYRLLTLEPASVSASKPLFAKPAKPARGSGSDSNEDVVLSRNKQPVGGSNPAVSK